MLPDESVETTEVLVELGQIQMRMGHAFKAQDTLPTCVRCRSPQRLGEQAARAALGYEEAVHQPGAPGGSGGAGWFPRPSA